MDNGGRPCSALEIIPDASAVYYEPVMNNQSIWATRVDYRTLRGHTSKHGGRSGSAIEIIPDASPVYYEPAMNDQSIWATEEDYRAWSGDTSMDGRQPPSQSQSWAEGEQPPSKKLRGYSVGDSGPSSKYKVLGGMLFKSKLCCKFRDGTCPYFTNCNFAHGMEELRKQEIVAAHEEDRLLEPREEHKIPILSSPAPAVDGQRSHKARHCKRFYTEEGCPYGDVCTFVHDERFKARERVAINLSPSVGGEDSASGASGLNQKPSNWKTRICKKWEMTASCPFGSKCHFAHGSTELLRYGGGLVEMEARDASVAMHDPKQSGASSVKLIADAVVAPNTPVPHAEVPGQSSTVVNQRQDQRPLQKWEGTDKISQFYADLIDDNE